MYDQKTGTTLRVDISDDAGPHVIVPMGQLDSVKSALADADIAYWIDEVSSHSMAEPTDVIIGFGNEQCRDTVQAILDAIP